MTNQPETVDEVELTSPIIDIELGEISWSRRKVLAVIVLWIVFWALVTIGMIWAVAFPFADYVGIERAMLIALVIILLNTTGG
jgi:uncharacterized membrane protein